MPDRSFPERPGTAALRFRGQDLEAIAALQKRNLDTVRRMANLMFDSTEAITERQAEFFKSGVSQMNAAFGRGEDESDPRDLFKRQAEACHDLLSAFTAHMGELTDITSNCCAGMIQEAAGSLVDEPMDGGHATRPTKSGGAVPKTSGKK